MTKPGLVMLAGPSGAGKTTVSKFVIPDGYQIQEFVNADHIAAGLSAFAPETVAFEAGRIMLRRIEHTLISVGSGDVIEVHEEKKWQRLLKLAAKSQS